MVTTVEPPSQKKAVLPETILTPRFYTTDFEAAANFDLSLQETEIKAMLEEMRTDYRNFGLKPRPFRTAF